MFGMWQVNEGLGGGGGGEGEKERARESVCVTEREEREREREREGEKEKYGFIYLTPIFISMTAGSSNSLSKSVISTYTVEGVSQGE